MSTPNPSPAMGSAATGPVTRREAALGFLAALAPFLSLALVGALLGGCVNPNTGSSTIVGEQMILPEITDSSDNIAVRVWEDIKGARVWTAKDSRVTISYSNCYTNSYLGCVTTRDAMSLAVEIEPLSVAADDTAASETTSPADAPDGASSN